MPRWAESRSKNRQVHVWTLLRADREFQSAASCQRLSTIVNIETGESVRDSVSMLATRRPGSSFYLVARAAPCLPWRSRGGGIGHPAAPQMAQNFGRVHRRTSAVQFRITVKGCSPANACGTTARNRLPSAEIAKSSHGRLASSKIVDEHQFVYRRVNPGEKNLAAVSRRAQTEAHHAEVAGHGR
jgi:hypothetical protein